MTDQVTVSSIQDFVVRVTEDASTSPGRLDLNVSSWTLYRGQAESPWPVSPSLYRDGLFRQERTLISELQRVSPREFEDLSRFDVLVKMQHYGLPTRLLDMTHNPLVALYFACEAMGSKDQDGSVYVFPNIPVFWQDNYAVRLVMQYVYDSSGFNLDLDNFLRLSLKDPLVNAASSNNQDFRNTVEHYLTRVPVMAVRPTLSNSRIVLQDGAFLLFGMSLKEKVVSTNPGTKGKTYMKLAPYPASENGKELWHHTIEYRIPARCKQEILSSLECLGITRNRLFPELQHQAEFVKELVAKETKS